jgi:Methyltransferase domain
MRWQLKCLAFHALRFMPRSFHRYAQKRTGRYWLRLTDGNLAAYRFHTTHFAGGKVVEFGCGRDLLAALLLSNAGAEEVLACDINRLATIEQINHVIRQLRWQTITDFDDLYRKYRIRYRAPFSLRDIPDNSADFICSTSTLEHVPGDQLREILEQCIRIGVPEAKLSFIVDYHDHYSTSDPRIGQFNFYRFGRSWKLFNPSNHYQNRLRHSDYVNLFHEFGLKPIIQMGIRAQGALPPLSGDFSKYDEEDLLMLNGIFLMSLPTNPGMEPGYRLGTAENVPTTAQ